MPKDKLKKINLLPQDEFEVSVLGRILKWALSSFRIMVIITELIVMSAFLSRFWLDAKNSDLNEKLEISKAQIEAYSDIELEFKATQKKLGIIKNLYNESKELALLNSVSKSIPSDIFLNSISINQNLLLIKASSFSESSIAQFVVNLENNKNFSEIALSQITTTPENPNFVKFNINGKVK